MDTVKEGYKQCEVGIIPEDWEARRIEEVCVLINGRGFKPYEWDSKGLPIVRIQNLNGSDEFNYYSGNYDSKIHIDHGQLLFAWSGSRGTSFGPHIWMGGQALLNYHTWKIKVYESIIHFGYFFYALHQLTKFIEDNAHGASALVHTQKGEMEKFLIPVPPTLKEQEAIADALTDMDKKIVSLDALIAKKCAIKQGTMQNLLTGQERLSGFSCEWEMLSISENATLKARIGWQGLTVAEYLDSGDYYLVTGTDFVDGRIDWDNCHYVDKDRYDQDRNIQLRLGDVLITKDGTIGKVAYIDNLPAETTLNSGVFVIRPTNQRINPLFLYYIFNSTIFTDFLAQLTAGSTINHLYQKDFVSFNFHAPEKEEQEQIANVLYSLDNEIAVIEKQRDKAITLKQGMMQELLTGKTRLI